ncbi:SPOR domain-containing protein [Nesterenkonia halotolerans]|uniref:SPOR domain-containing protein n=1 Tax=Nesterenkonia halotolerans TaxID=225325 RepID=UPI003EE6277C
MSTEYWFNVRTGAIEEGAQSSWKHLLGPYASRDEAAEALKRVEANNEAWDEETSEHWDDDGGHGRTPKS